MELKIFWDIENISYKKYPVIEKLLKTKFHSIENIEKYIFCTQEVLKSNTINNFLNDKWNIVSGESEKQGSDKELITHIQKNIDNTNLFVIISDDNDFDEKIKELLKINKKVLLITNARNQKNIEFEDDNLKHFHIPNKYTEKIKNTNNELRKLTCEKDKSLSVNVKKNIEDFLYFPLKILILPEHIFQQHFFEIADFYIFIKNDKESIVVQKIYNGFEPILDIKNENSVSLFKKIEHLILLVENKFKGNILFCIDSKTSKILNKKLKTSIKLKDYIDSNSIFTTFDTNNLQNNYSILKIF